MSISKRVLFIAVVLILSHSTLLASTTVTYGYFDVTFFDYDGSATEGNWTSEQMADVGSAINTWSAGITNEPGRQIQMHAYWDEMDDTGTNVLGGSGSYRISNGNFISNLGEYVWRDCARSRAAKGRH